jgi:protein transport protein SEC61 subunit alpha
VKGLKNQDSVFKVLKSLIPVAAVLGGVLIGLISALTDMLGSVIPGTNIFMVCNIIDSLYKSLKEKE